MGKSPFAGIENAEVGFAREPFLRCRNIKRDLTLDPKKNIISSDPVAYWLRIDGAEMLDTSGGDFFKTKFTVMNVEGQREGDGTNEINSAAVWMLNAKSRGFQRDFKTFVCTACNMVPSLLKQSDSERIIGRDQPLTAWRKYIRAVVTNIKTQEEQKDFTRHDWSPLDPVWAADGVTLINLVTPARDEVKIYRDSVKDGSV